MAEEDEKTAAEDSKGSTPVLMKILEKRKILLSGEVNAELAHKIIMQLLYLEAEDPESPIDLLINSPGGEVASGLAIYDTIRGLSAPVNCICSGLTASIATIILIAPEKSRRFAQKHASILIHQPLGGIRGQATDIDIHAREILKTKKMVNEMLAEATGQDIEQINKDTNRDFWMSADEALAYGLVSEIIGYKR
jgi:ATP-dependent Clp protease protease subunit